MITIEHKRIYKLTLTASKRSWETVNEEYFYRLMDEHLEKREQGDYFFNCDAIFNWLEKNTRQYVPYKKVYGKPSFRAHKQKNGEIVVVAEWEVDKNSELDFL